VRVLAADGHRVDLGQVYHPAGDGIRVAVGIRSGLAEGSYLVLWRVVSADSHPVAGSFTFSLGRAGPVAAGTSDSSGRDLAIASGVNRFLGYAGLVALVGGVAFLLVCWPAGWPLTPARAVIWCGLIATGGSAVAGLALQGAADVGASLSQVTDMTPIRALLATRFGHAHLVRIALLLGIAITLWAAHGSKPGGCGRPC
jgi:copper transport protein